ncbi:MAG TPA: GNAT family N-acetyltransferase [Actinocatenispora sp.]
MRLEQLTAGHRAAVLDFETVNRDYFTGFISDRGDEYFARFAEMYAGLLAEQDAGICRFHVLVADDGTVAGRVNLVDLVDGAAELGYRIARAYAGQGLATDGVRQVCARAASRYGLRRLHAVTSVANRASQAVLRHNGFVLVGDTEIVGRPGFRFHRDLPPPPDA